MKKLVILACLLSFTCLLRAQDALAAETAVSDAPFNQVTVWDFVFGIGYNYRKFHKVKLYKGSDMPNYKPNTRGGQTRAFINPPTDPTPTDPTPTDPTPTDPTPTDPSTPSGTPDPIWHDYEEQYERPIHIGNADFGSRECFGSELNIGIPCFRHDALRIDGLFGFMFYECDTKLTVQGAHTEYDMQMQTYDIGAKASYKINDYITASVSLGPSFNFTSLDTSSNGHRSDKDSLQVGAFAAAGVQVWFNKYIGVGADIRYDKVFDNASTRYSDLDLDTWNTDLKFLFRF